MKRKSIVTAASIILLLWGSLFPVYSQNADQLYFKAESCYLSLVKSPDKLQFRYNWFPCIDQFKEAYKANPKGKYAPASIFMTGKLFQELYHISFKESDKTEAIGSYQKIIKDHKGSTYLKKAREGLLELTGDRDVLAGTQTGKKERGEIFKSSKESYRKQKTVSPKYEEEKITPVVVTNPVKEDIPKVVITSLRVWSNPSYTRVVIDADGDTTYTHRLLNEDPSVNKLKRLYIDFEDSMLGQNIQSVVSINDDLLQSARAAQNEANMVRIVIDIKSFETYKIFSIRNPFRTIIDLWGTGSGTTFASSTAPIHSTATASTATSSPSIPTPPAVAPYHPPATYEKPVSADPPERQPRPIETAKAENPISLKKNINLADQLNLGVSRIVLDPGHGGHDVGAVGFGVYEKDITLAIAKRLKRHIQSKVKGCTVFLTRDDDRYLALEERTAIANMKNADLFLSIHTNAHRNSEAYGIETYFLNLADDDESKLVAKRENAATFKNLSDLEKILMDLMQTTKVNESRYVASYVQKSMFNRLNQKYDRIKDKGVKRAPFYVLIGANMPSILIETSFISNRRECRRLTDPNYQDQLAAGILEGVIKYVSERNSTAYFIDTEDHEG